MTAEIVSIRYWRERHSDTQANLLLKIQGTSGDVKAMYDKIKKLEV